MTELLRLHDLSVLYGALAALQGVHLAVRAGEQVALVGANGSGKSTLLRAMHGLLAPSAGHVQMHGTVRQAMVFQRPHMLRMSALRNVELGLWLAGTPRAQIAALANAALARVGLASVARQSARSLSGGQQQRLALARAWALRPDMLLLDEPTASLDPQARRDVEALIAEFAASGMTLVFASHNLGQVHRLASRVVYLEQGRLLADMPCTDFFNPKTLALAAPEASRFLREESP